MNEQLLPEFVCEPERYELFEKAALSDLDRRQFFRIVGSGIVVALLVPRELAAQQPAPKRQRRGGGALPQEIGAWLHIGEDSVVTVFTGKVEIGQNIRTALTQGVAEELHTPVERIRLVMA